MIDAGTVLNKLNILIDDETNQTKEFGLQVLTSDGSVREMLCRKNVSSPRAALVKGKTAPRGKFNYNLKMNGIVLVQDVIANSPRSIKAACILQFKDFGSSQWVDVRH